MIEPQNYSAPTVAVAEPPRLVGEVAQLLSRSTTAVKKMAVEVHAPIVKTPSGVWLFPPVAVEKLRVEIARRERERDR